MPTEITLEEVQDRIKGLPSETQRAVVCALVGHSRIKDTGFGYVYCGRCEAEVGDTLVAAYSIKEDVMIGHNCETCRLNYQSLTWRDTFMAKDPFQEKGER